MLIALLPGWALLDAMLLLLIINMLETIITR